MYVGRGEVYVYRGGGGGGGALGGGGSLGGGGDWVHVGGGVWRWNVGVEIDRQAHSNMSLSFPPSLQL